MADQSENPYTPPDARSGVKASPLIVKPKQILVRNLIAWSISFAFYCIVDYFHVHHGSESVSWFSEGVFLPAFYSVFLFANRVLFSSIKRPVARWCAIAAVSLIVAGFGLIALIFLGVYFHIAIGGRF